MGERESPGDAAPPGGLDSFWGREIRQLSRWDLPPASSAALRRQGFELSSRGDRVTGRLWWPSAGATPRPLVLLGHGTRASADAPESEAAAAAWGGRGFSTAAVDLPLHGARWGEKLSLFLFDTLARARPGASPSGSRSEGELLCRELLRQARADFSRLVDALLADPALEIDPRRVAFAGFSLGALVGAHVVAGDARIGSAVLAATWADFASPGFDLDPALAAIAPRPKLWLELAAGPGEPPAPGGPRPAGANTRPHPHPHRRCTDPAEAVSAIGAWLAQRFAGRAG